MIETALDQPPARRLRALGFPPQVIEEVEASRRDGLGDREPGSAERLMERLRALFPKTTEESR